MPQLPSMVRGGGGGGGVPLKVRPACTPFSAVRSRSAKFQAHIPCKPHQSARWGASLDMSDAGVARKAYPSDIKNWWQEVLLHHLPDVILKFS